MKKNLLFIAILCILCGAPGWANNYSSADGGLVYKSPEGMDTKVYYPWHLERLSVALSPRYIRFIDIERYGKGGERVAVGVLFTYNGGSARSVSIAGNFSNWAKRSMRRNSLGVWYVIVPLTGRYQKDRLLFEYKFNADGVWDYDRTGGERVSDGYGSFFSVFRLPPEAEDVEQMVTVRKLPKFMQDDYRRTLYEFQLYRPKANNVFIVGTFNNWNPDHDAAMLGKDGIWRVRVYLNKGEYLYRFIVDGKWELDTNNDKVGWDAVSGVKASLLNVEEK